ncbi:hypothetical protein FOA20_05480 [Peribacillus simplex]
MYDERESNGLSVNDIAKMTGVPRSTIYAKVKEMTSKYFLYISFIQLYYHGKNIFWKNS